MFTPVKVVQLACVAAMVAVASVEGHGYMSVPKATFSGGGDPTQFCATMDGPKTLTAPAGQSFTSDPASNAKAFTAALKSSSYKSLRDLIDTKGVFISGANKQCGVTSPTGAKQPLPDKYVEWAHSNEEGFTPSHQGPCEIWCDNKLALSNDNCPKNYPTAPAKLPYDHSKCLGASMLKIYWLALHSSTWQAYINCAPLQPTSGGDGGGGSASSPVVSPTTAPSKGTPSKGTPTKAPATKAPSKGTPTTKKPGTGGDTDEDCEFDIAGSSKNSEVGADADDEDCELDIPSTKKPKTGADDDDDCELDVADEASATPKPATKAPTKTDSTKQSSGYRSMEYGFDALDESD